jgi:hypothetical protein
VDAATNKALEAIIGPMDECSSKKAQLPIRLGGLGIFSSVKHATIACFDSRRLAGLIARQLVGEAIGAWMDAPSVESLPEELREAGAILLDIPGMNLAPRESHMVNESDPMTPIDLELLVDEEEVRTDSGESGVASGAPPRPMVKSKLRASIHELVLKEVLALATTDQKVRLSSARAPHNGYWLSVPFGVPPTTRLLGSLFTVACRVRLGLPIGTKEAYSCPLCGQEVVDDEHRLHMYSCMSGGGRSHLHNVERRTLSSLMSVALFQPREETHCFTEANLRADITFSTCTSATGSSIQHCIDLAFTSPFVDGGRRAAMSTPGGAATRYEAEKRVHYAHLINEATQVFHPVVCDMLGAWGRSAQPILKDIASAYAKRYPQAITAKIHFYSTLNTILVRHLARSLSSTLPASG